MPDTSALCAACDHPQDSHGIRYAASIGDHEWVPEVWAGPATEPGSRIYRAADGGLAMWTDPSRPTPGDRLPMRQRIENTDPTPAPP